MELKTVTLQLPEPIYNRYKERAEQTHRTKSFKVLN
jgi:predicted DNA-binding protein